MAKLSLVYTRVNNEGDMILVQTDKWSPAHKVPFVRAEFADSIEAQAAAAQKYQYGTYLGWTILPVKGVWDIAHVFDTHTSEESA